MVHSLAPAETPADSRLEEILGAVRAVFAEKGFDRASMQDLARAAGMSAGNFYRYFPSKDAIIETLVRRELAMMARHFGNVMGAADPLAELRRTIHAEMELYDDSDCAIWMEIMVSSGRHDGIGGLYANMLEVISGYLVEIFGRIAGIGTAAAQEQFQCRAEMIVLLIQGIHLHRRRTGGDASPALVALCKASIDQQLYEITGARDVPRQHVPGESLDA